MKILLVHNFYRSENIGGEDLVFNNEVLFLKKALGNDNVLTYSVSNDNLKLRNIIFSFPYSLFHHRKIFSIIKNEKINIVHVHNFFPLLSPSVFVASKKAGAKVVLTLHNYRIWCISGLLYKDGYGICEKCNISSRRYHGIIGKCYRKSFLQSIIASIAFNIYQSLDVYKNIDKYFVLTEFQKKKVEELGIDNKKIIVKPNFIENSNDYKINYKDRKEYCYIGRLEEAKGIIVLLEVWKSLGKDYYLNIIGRGPLDSLVRRYAETYPNIKYEGQLNNIDTMEKLNNAKYLIQPSLWYETFGLTIIEAFLLGVPVIGFNIGTRKDLIINEYNGFLCNKQELKNTIIKSYTYSKYEILSENCRDSVRQFLCERIIEDQIKIYKRIDNE